MIMKGKKDFVREKEQEITERLDPLIPGEGFISSLSSLLLP